MLSNFSPLNSTYDIYMVLCTEPSDWPIISHFVLSLGKLVTNCGPGDHLKSLAFTQICSNKRLL